MTAVTVVITSYNQGPLIREAVESALSQTVRPERIIIVDDGSDEQTSVDVLSAILDDCRHGALDTGGVAVDFIDQVNAGPSAARNRGIAAAETPFVVVLDGDDRLMPTFIERTLPLLTVDDSMVASSAWLRTFGVLDSVIQPTGGDAGAFVSHNCCPATCMIRRSAWERCGGYDESMRSGFEDWDFFLSLLESGLAGGAGEDDADGTGDIGDAGDAKEDAAHIGIVSEPLIEYRTAPASSNVTSMTKRLDLMRYLINKHHDLYTAHVVDAVLGAEAISMERLSMWETLMRGDKFASQEFMRHPTYGDGGMAAAVRLQS
jgi:glycosyltransferase involved in cell wall biosynthesis